MFPLVLRYEYIRKGHNIDKKREDKEQESRDRDSTSAKNARPIPVSDKDRSTFIDDLRATDDDDDDDGWDARN